MFVQTCMLMVCARDADTQQQKRKRKRRLPLPLYHHLCPRYGVSGGLGYSPLTNLRTHSGMISQSTCTAVAFLQTYKGSRLAPHMFITDQNFLYSFFLIPEFLLQVSCPRPNHCCLRQVTVSASFAHTMSVYVLTNTCVAIYT